MRLILPLLFFITLTLMNGCSRQLSFDEYVQKAKQLSQEGKTERAIEAYKKASQIKPDEPEVHDVLGRLYFKQLVSQQVPTNAKEAEQYEKTQNEIRNQVTTEFKKAIELDPSKWFARYMVATDHYNNKRYDEAIKGYVEVIKTNPKYSTAYGMLAESHLAIGDYATAKNFFDKEYRLDHDQENYYCGLGKVYYMTKDYNKGFEMLMWLKGKNSPYYDHLFNFKITHNIP